jgi:predicted nucleic acid-binding protein
MSADARPLSFVDTNVLVYALATDDPERSAVAQTLLRELMTAQVFRCSTQVLAELFVTLTRKIRTPLTAQQAMRYLDTLAVWPAVVPDYGAIREAIELSASVHISFWDALVVIAAARAGAAVLYTEDLQHGQRISGVEIMNPFRGSPEQRARR